MSPKRHSKPTVAERPLITDHNIVARMGVVEGDWWLETEVERRHRPHPDSVYAWQRHYEELLEQVKVEGAAGVPEYMGEPPSGLLWGPEGNTGAIYGSGGTHRYLLCNDGEVVFSRHHATSDGCRRAEAAGFRLT